MRERFIIRLRSGFGGTGVMNRGDRRVLFSGRIRMGRCFWKPWDKRLSGVAGRCLRAIGARFIAAREDARPIGTAYDTAVNGPFKNTFGRRSRGNEAHSFFGNEPFFRASLRRLLLL